MKHLYYKILLFVSLMVLSTINSCSNEEELFTTKQKVLLQITTEITGTRAIKEGTTFEKGDTIGLLLTTPLEAGVPQIFGTTCNVIENCYAVYDGTRWVMSKDINLSEVNSTVTVMAYYPYRVLSQFPRKAYVVLMRPFEKDYMFSSDDVTEYNPIARLTFSHSMAKLTISVKKDATYTGKGVINSVTLNDFRGWKIKTIANTLIDDHVINYPDYDNYSQTINREIGDNQKIDFLIIPEEITNKLITVVVDDKKYWFKCPDVSVEAGSNYIFNVVIKGETIPDTKTVNGHKGVYLGFKDNDGNPLYWATCNVGATNEEETGDYFAWGEVSTKQEYWPVTGAFSGSIYSMTRVQMEKEGIVDKEGNLTSKYDAASVNWGSSWRTPTNDEYQAMIANCRNEYSVINDMGGQLITGPNGNSIFMPLAGYWLSNQTSVNKYSNYWTATLMPETTNGKYCPYTFYFYGEGTLNLYTGWKAYTFHGQTVRAVTK